MDQALLYTSMARGHSVLHLHASEMGTLQGRCGPGQAAPFKGDRLHLGGVGDAAGVPLLG
jgi:hypothetical protein